MNTTQTKTKSKICTHCGGRDSVAVFRGCKSACGQISLCYTCDITHNEWCAP